MSRDEVIDILLNEMECVQRASDDECNRDCAKCDLLRDTDEILQAYRISIKALEHPEENVVAIVPCGDCISRQAAIDIVDSYSDSRSNVEDVTQDIISDIVALPSVAPQQKIGRWIRWYEVIESADGKSTEHIPHCKCSECGTEYDPHSSQFIKYCNECGAKMQEVEG